MAKKNEVPFEKKLRAVNIYLEGKYSLRYLADKFNVHHSSIEKWVRLYEMYGESGLKARSRYNRYDENFKKEMVSQYLSSQCSMSELCKKYGIRSTSSIQIWVGKYQAE